MRARMSTWLGVAGVASLVILAATLNITRTILHGRGRRIVSRARARLRACTSRRGGPRQLCERRRSGFGIESSDYARREPRRRAPLSATEELAARKAWPAAKVRRDQIDRAQQDFDGIKRRGHHGSRSALNWVSIGPSVAFQPGVLGFTGKDQVTSGRTTALLVDRTCNQGHCRVWIGAAGGGIWRTDKGLHTNNPGWKFSSDGLGSNAFGSLAQDPNDEDGDTLYAGTGEPNASADSEAGVGLYKSTDGGESWQLIPATVAIAATRSIAKIVIDPTDGRIIYIATARGVRGISSTSGGAVSTTGTPQPNMGVYKTTNGGVILDADMGCADRRVAPRRHRSRNRSTRPDDGVRVSVQLGIYRSLSGGPFQQVFAGQAPDYQH